MANYNVTKERYKYIGGSDLPTILGLNAKYGVSIYEFAKEKANITPNTFKGNQYTKYGQKMEPVIREYINSLYQVNYVEDTIIDSVKGYRGNTDGIDRTNDVPILEIKTFGEELDVDYYTPQCQFYMEVFNQDACLLVGYKRPEDFYTGVDYDLESEDSYFNLSFDENRIVIHTIYRDKNYWNKIENRINEFKKAVDKLKEDPNITEEEFNNIFYGTNLISLTKTITELERQLNAVKHIETQLKRAKEDLYNLFEEKNIISLDTGNIKITKVSPTSYDTVSIDSVKLQEENPILYEKYKITKTTNKKGYILITPKKESEI